MASGVSVKMGVSGVAQFKQSMKEGQQAVKTLDEQLKLNEAQLKLNGNEELALQNKTKILTEQIAKQADVVKQGQQALELMRKNGVAETSAEFQKMQQNVYRASTDLVNMRVSLEGVGEAGEEAQQGVSEMNQSLQRIGMHADYDSVINGISKITGGLEAAAQKAINLSKKLLSAMISGGQWADDISEKSIKWEIPAEDVYRMEQTALEIDTSAETIIGARKKLITAMGKDSDKETMGAFAALGISNLSGTDENIENVFWRAGEALMGFSDKVTRNEYAMKIYGKSWEELIPIFKTGRSEYEKIMASWTWVGDKEFNKLTEFDDQRNRLESEWQAFQHQFEAAIAPALTSVMETLEGLLKEFNTYLQTEDGQKMLESLGEAISGLFEDLTKIEPENVIKNLTSVFTSITEGLKWLIENRGKVVEALKYIVAGWATVKVTGGALQVLNLINGAKGLTGVGSGAGGTGNTDVVPGGTGSDVSTTGKSFFGGILDKAVNAAAAGEVLKDTERLLNWARSAGAAGGGALGYAGEFNRIGLENGWISEEQAEQNRIMAELFAGNQEAVEGLNEATENLNKSVEDWQTTHIDGKGDSDLTIFKDRRTGEILEIRTHESLDRMSEVAGEMNGKVESMGQSSDKMSAAAEALAGLPAEMQSALVNAIITGMSNVTITINESGIDGIGRRIFSKNYQSFFK